MSIWGDIRGRIVDWLAGMVDEAYSKRTESILDRREYRLGMQKEFLKASKDGYNDNIIVNYIKDIVDKSVSLLFGKSVEFEFEQGEDETEASPEEEYVDTVWTANDKDNLLHNIATFGAEAGLALVKIDPEGRLYKGQKMPRLINLDPSFIDIQTDPHDKERVTKYTIQYAFVDPADGKETAFREITEWTPNSDTDPNSGYWLITAEINKGGNWQPYGDPLSWEWDFAPIVHTQNLPNPADVWGMPDITTDVINLQNQINFGFSNRNRIVRYYAHPMRWGVNLTNYKELGAGPDKIISFGDPNAAINQEPAVGDLAAANDLGVQLHQGLYSTTHTVDLASLADKVGALTNFGLHVLFNDALSKLETKRRLYGRFLKEINRRLLLLNGMQELESECVWPDPLPEDPMASLQADQTALNMGIVDKQTIAERQGYDWEKVSERKQEEQQGEENVGSFLLNAFNRGQER